MGRPDFSGGSQATAKIWTICSGVNLPGGPDRGSSRRTCSMARRKAAWLSRHSMRMSRSQASAQRRRQRLTCRRDSPTWAAIWGLPLAVKGQEDDGGPLPELGRRRGGVLNSTENVVLTFGDGHLGRFTRHAEDLPGGCESSKAG